MEIKLTLGLAIFIFLVQFVSYFVKGLAGFGDPLISNPMLSMTEMQNNQITPMNLLMNWPLNFYISMKNRKSFSIRRTLPILIFDLMGMIPGVLLLKMIPNADSWILKALLGLVIVISGIEMLTRKESTNASGNFLLMAIMSIASGLTAGLFGINLFFVAYIERTGYVNRNQFRGEICFVFFIENTIRLIMYIAAGFYTLTIIKLALISAVGVIFGMFFGSRVDTKLSEKTVRKIITIVFICAGFSTLIKALIFKI